MTDKIVEELYLQGGQKAVLLLHSFTSNAKEMRHLATKLHAQGYTCYVPNLAGHGAGPEMLFASSMEAIWQGAQQAFDVLLKRGFKQITVVGQSLGGVLGIRLANQYAACEALCILSSPVIERPIDGLEERVAHFSLRYFQGKPKQELEAFLQQHFPRPPKNLVALQQFIVQTGKQIHLIHQPLFLAKGLLDEAVFQESMDLIASSVQSARIEKKSYEKSGHLITLGKEREQLAADILAFLKDN